MKIAIIGCGMMGGSIARRLASFHSLSLYDIHIDKAEVLAAECRGKVCTSVQEALSGVSLVILAVKPKGLDYAAKALSDALHPNQLLISILAMVNLEKLASHFPSNCIVRAMPNIPVEVGKGMVGLAAAPSLLEEYRTEIEAALNPLGSLYWIKEAAFDAFTAIAGSGPALIAIIIESIIDAGIHMGLSAKDSRQYALDMIEGTACMLKKLPLTPSEMKWRVTSPAGTTIRGVRALERSATRSSLLEAFLAMNG